MPDCGQGRSPSVSHRPARIVALGIVMGALANALAGTAAAADVSSGARLYSQYCVGCHGDGGRNVMPDAPNFARGERLMQPDVMLLNTIRTGKLAMPGFVGILSDRQILDVVAYMRTLRR